MQNKQQWIHVHLFRMIQRGHMWRFVYIIWSVATSCYCTLTSIQTWWTVTWSHWSTFMFIRMADIVLYIIGFSGHQCQGTLDFVRSCLIQLFKWCCSYNYETEFVPTLNIDFIHSVSGSYFLLLYTDLHSNMVNRHMESLKYIYIH
jgi:hypothetical protein